MTNDNHQLRDTYAEEIFFIAQSIASTLHRDTPVVVTSPTGWTLRMWQRPIEFRLHGAVWHALTRLGQDLDSPEVTIQEISNLTECVFHSIIYMISFECLSQLDRDIDDLELVKAQEPQTQTQEPILPTKH